MIGLIINKTKTRAAAITLAAYTAFHIELALAASKDWIKPAVDILGDVKAGIIWLGIAAIGIAIAIVALVSIFKGDVPWKWVMAIGLGGLALTVGPGMFETLLPS